MTDQEHAGPTRRDADAPEEFWQSRGLFIEEIYPLSAINPERTESQCSSCGVGPDDPVYPADQVSVVGHWANSTDVEKHVIGWWYCPTHLASAKLPWKGWQGAPEALWGPRLRGIKYPDCQQAIELGSTCGQPFSGYRDGLALCADHVERWEAQQSINARMAAIFDTEAE